MSFLDAIKTFSSTLGPLGATEDRCALHPQGMDRTIF